MEQLLHPVFLEIGRSGKSYDREEILSEFQSAASLPTIRSSDFEISALTESQVLLCYTSTHETEDCRVQKRTRRTSLWIKQGEQWQLRFHQGTALPDAADN